MASNDLIIDDEFCTSMGAYFVKQGNHIDSVINQYTAILEDIRQNGIMAGDVADALSAYISYVSRLKNQVGSISGIAKTQIGSFLAAVDNADQYLF